MSRTGVEHSYNLISGYIGIGSTVINEDRITRVLGYVLLVFRLYIDCTFKTQAGETYLE